MARPQEAIKSIAEAVGLTTWPAFLAACASDAKIIYILGGWRGGKSARTAFILLVRILLVYIHRPGRHLFWLVGPDYDMAREEYFYLNTWCATKLGMQVTASTATQGSLHMEISAPGLPGIIEVVTKSATDPASLGRVAPVEIAMCEAGLITEEADMWIDGRTAEKNANVIKSGTFENDDGKAQMAWFEQQADQVLQNPTPRREAYSCPTWENAYLYGDCRPMLVDDPGLSQWCIDEEHGTLHSGLAHPMIRQLKERWAGRPTDWDKRFGGIPTGVRNPVYEWAKERELQLLIPMPPELKTPTFGSSPIWIETMGGIDPGLIHPASLVVGSKVNTGPHKGETWVRACIIDHGNSAKTMWQAKDFLQKKYGVKRWGGDPNGLQYTREVEDIDAMRGSLYQRESRVKVVNGVANDNMLFFDADEPGVVLLFEQLKRIHRRKDASGQLVYDKRADDDMAAAFEDMMAELHGTPILEAKNRYTPRRYKYTRHYAPVRTAS